MVNNIPRMVKFIAAIILLVIGVLAVLLTLYGWFITERSFEPLNVLAIIFAGVSGSIATYLIKSAFPRPNPQPTATIEPSHHYTSIQNTHHTEISTVTNLNQNISVVAPADDPYHDYLEKLLKRINGFLAQKIIRPHDEPIPLESEVTSDAVDALFAKHHKIDPLYVVGGIDDKPKEEYTDFAEAFKYYDGQVLLLGAPGAGKTMTLLRYGRDGVMKRMENPSAPLPILGIIPDWIKQEKSSLVDWLAESFSAPLNTKALLESGKALLLLDGLDELGSEREDAKTKEIYDPRLRFMQALERVPGIVETHRRNRVLVTCRVQDYADIGTKIKLKGAVTLKPLTDDQMHAYLSEQPHLLDAIAQDERLREMLKTPLLLSIFTFGYQDMTEIERQEFKNLQHAGDVRDKIFERYVNKRYEHEVNKLKLRQEEPPFTLEEVYEVLGYVATTDVIRLYEDNIIRYSSFQEYGFNDEEVNRFTNWIMQLDILVWNERVMLYELPLHEGVTIYEESWRFVHLLLRDFLAYGYCLSHLRDNDADVRESASHALEKLVDARAVKPLIATLRDSSAKVRLHAVRALENLGNVHAVEPLIRSLQDRNTLVRSFACSALGKLGDVRAVEPLIIALRDSDSGVRQSSARALGRLRDRRAVEPLATTLHDPDGEVRQISAFVLGRLGDKRAVELLISLLEDETEVFPLRICDEAADALERIGTPEALAAVEAWRRGQQ